MQAREESRGGRVGPAVLGVSPTLMLAGLLALVSGGLVAAAVAAHVTSSPTSLAVTLPPSKSYVYGTVSSPKASCAPDRRVRLMRKRDGNDELIAAERSFEQSGVVHYTVETPTGDPLNPGSYYSRVKKLDLAPGSRHDHICERARSSRIDVKP